MNTKKIVKLIFILYLAFQTEALYAQSTYLVIPDLRDSVIQPNFYNRNLKVNFKRASTMSIPKFNNNEYVTVMGLRAWGDDSGGSVHELVFSNSNGLYYRTGLTNGGWRNWQKIISENLNGNVGIGIDSPNERLAVNGNIRAKEIKVEASNWPDYVFEKNYDLPKLSFVRDFITQNKHLPDVPKASDVEQDGVSLGEMNKILLKKIEELTLYLIDNEKKREDLESDVKELRTTINKLLDNSNK